MSITAEREELHQLSGALLKCVTSLASKCGDTPAMRRVINDAERIVNGIDRVDIDVEEPEMKRGLSQPNGSSEMIQIPDTEYHIDFWRTSTTKASAGRTARVCVFRVCGSADRKSLPATKNSAVLTAPSVLAKAHRRHAA